MFSFTSAAARESIRTNAGESGGGRGGRVRLGGSRQGGGKESRGGELGVAVRRVWGIVL